MPVTSLVARAKGVGTWRVGDCPREPKAFLPRESLAEQLNPEGASGPVVSVLVGGRGNGKTQLAGAHFRGRVDKLRLAAWIEGATESSIISGLADVARTVGIGLETDQTPALASLARHWLEADGSDCLLVFDNVESPDHLLPYLPATGTSHTIITTTHTNVTDLGTTITVAEFTEEEGLTYLTTRTGKDNPQEAKIVGENLGWMPLALAQAAALIKRENLTYATYSTRLANQKVSNYIKRLPGTDYPHHTAQAILLSVNTALKVDPTLPCEPLLEAISILAETGTSRRLLHTLRFTKDQPTPNDPQIDAALAILTEASLLTFTKTPHLGPHVTAHRLVMRILRERLTEKNHLSKITHVISHRLVTRILRKRLIKKSHLSRITRMVTQALHDQINKPEAKEIVWARELVTQIHAVNDHVGEHYREPTREAAQLLDLRATSITLLVNDLGDCKQAIADGELLVIDAEQILGVDHPVALHARDRLARAYELAGQLNKAIPLYEQTLADRKRVLGDDHRATLGSCNNLAGVYESAGQLDKAIPLYEQTWADRKRVLGDDHPHTLHSCHNLADAYQSAGQLDKAIPLFEQTLADLIRVLGDDHPHTLLSCNTLAGAYQSAGQLDKAIPLFEQTLADSKRVLGGDHPGTIVALWNLAYSYQLTSQLDTAILLFEQTLADCERVLSPGHP
ncbi:MAG: tetratricopeptide repeat protein, partial [Propionibacteriaceae bacterium]|nr:tetratricopeptide repeat protein [Propionibacteriaceae bacterium]